MGTVSERLAGAFVSIDKQAPFLTYFGFAAWAVWNVVAFSGSFWLEDTTDNLYPEVLIFTHLAVSAAALVVFFIFSKWTKRIVAKNWFTAFGSLAAFLGSLGITTAHSLPIQPNVTFNISLSFTACGMTILLMRAACLFGALPPRRALIHFASCALVAAGIFFMMGACGDVVANVIFVCLPLLSALLFSLRPSEVYGQSGLIKNESRFSSATVFFFVSVGLGSFAVEVIRACTLIDIAADYSNASTTFSQLITAVLMIIAIIFMLLSKSDNAHGRIYLYILAAIVVLLAMAGSFPIPTLAAVSLTEALRNCFNIIIWAILVYVAYQAQSSIIKIFAMGNAALALGSFLGELVAQLNHTYGMFSAFQLRILFLILGVLLLVDLLYILRRRVLSRLLLPIEQKRLARDTLGPQEKRPGQWMMTCETVAEKYGLTKRESEIFMSLARGRSAQEIAEHESLSVYTVRGHISSIHAKLGVHSKKELTALIEEQLEHI